MFKSSSKVLWMSIPTQKCLSLRVSQACYGILKVPRGNWLCRTCALGVQPKCLLCPKRGGALKPTRSGTKWVHVSCALWIPEVRHRGQQVSAGFSAAAAHVGLASFKKRLLCERRKSAAALLGVAPGLAHTSQLWREPNSTSLPDF